MKTEIINFKRGDTIFYNDGRKGHTNVKAEILEVHSIGMIVQFEDRADTTAIYFDETEWMDRLTF